MAKALAYKFIVTHLDKGHVYSYEEQFFGLYHRSIDDFLLEVIDNPDGKYDNLFIHDENFKAAQKKRRALERRAVGGWR